MLTRKNRLPRGQFQLEKAVKRRKASESISYILLPMIDLTEISLVGAAFSCNSFSCCAKV